WVPVREVRYRNEGDAPRCQQLADLTEDMIWVSHVLENVARDNDGIVSTDHLGDAFVEVSLEEAIHACGRFGECHRVNPGHHVAQAADLRRKKPARTAQVEHLPGSAPGKPREHPPVRTPSRLL